MPSVRSLAESLCNSSQFSVLVCPCEDPSPWQSWEYTPCLETCCLPALLQARVLSCFSRVRLCVAPGTAARQAPLSMGILQARLLWGGCGVAMPSSRRSSWSRNQPTSLMSPALAGEFFTPSAPWATLLHAHSTAGERFPSFPGEASHPVLMAHISINHKTAKPYFCLFVCASSFSHESVEVLACSGSCSLSWAVVWRAPYSFK